MNLGCDVVLDVVPVCGDQVCGPTSTVSDEYSRRHLCPKLMEMIFVRRGKLGLKYYCQSTCYTWTIKWSATSSFISLLVYLVCFGNTRRIPFVFPTFLNAPTEPEEQRYLLLLYGLRVRQFCWFLIGVGLICCDSNITKAQNMRSNQTQRWLTTRHRREGITRHLHSEIADAIICPGHGRPLG